MNTPAKIETPPAPATIEDVLMRGDMSKLTPQQRIQYTMDVCNSLGLNWRTRPFEFITLGGKLVFYARKDATDQLRKLHGISVEIIGQEFANDLLTVRARATDKTGRHDEDIGVVAFKNVYGEIAANLRMKAVTKAKRRVTLSIAGLGFLDETETGDENAEIDAPTGELISPEQLKKLDSEIEELGIERSKFREFLGKRWDVQLSSLADISADNVADAMEQVERKRKQIERGDAQGEALL